MSLLCSQTLGSGIFNTHQHSEVLWGEDSKVVDERGEALVRQGNGVKECWIMC